MEKFGIFDLLDALSAATSPPAAEDGGNSPSPSETKDDAPAVKPDAHDTAFAAPAYGSPAVQNMQNPAEHAGEDRGENAYNAFLARHDEAVKRIEKKR